MPRHALFEHRLPRSIERLGVAAIALLLAAPASGLAAESSPAAVAAVSDATTLDVQFDDGNTQHLRLLGLPALDAGQSACGAEQATARARELVEGQNVLVELPDSQPSSTEPAAYVWLADGRNLAEILIREGGLPAATDDPHPLAAEFAAAQAAAIADRVGIWAAGACGPASTTESQPVVDRQALSAYVTSTSDAVYQARLAAGILSEQGRSAPAVGTTAEWRNTTSAAMAWLDQAMPALEAPAPDALPADVVHANVVRIASDLRREAGQYAAALAGSDTATLGATGAQFRQSANDLSAIGMQLDAVATSYALGD